MNFQKKMAPPEIRQRAEKPSGKAAGMVLDLLFPRRCPVCDKPVKPFGGIVCRDCVTTFDRIGESCCRICGKPVHGGDAELCPDCAERMHYFHRGAAVFSYRSARYSLYRFKYAGREEYADWFGLEMAARMMRVLRPRPDTILVPVPVSKKRMRQRGYNQAALLALKIGERTGLEVNKSVLFRTVDTPPLKTLGERERRKFLRDAFHVYGNDVKLRHVMLIDDIYTTGATMDSCSRALLEAGALEVNFTVLAAGELECDDQRTESQTDDQNVYL